MIRHYFDIATRSLRKHPGYTCIHLAGLACGFAVAVLIFLFVQDELSFDRFHAKSDRIARLIAYRGNGDGQLTPMAHMPLPLGPAILEEVPGARSFVRLSGSNGEFVTAGDVQAYENITYADPTLFSVFSFPLIHGDASALFSSPSEVVLTEALAIKYFGSTDVLGKTLNIFLQGARRAFTITGVAGNVPANSSIQFTLVIPMTAVFRYEAGSTRWNWWRVHTYVEFDRPLAEVDTTNVSGLFGRHRSAQSTDDPVPLELQPLGRVHLDPTTGGSNPLYSYLLAGIALVILLIAGINYVSLGIARGTVRAREVAVRKLLGAARPQVIRQFLAESLLLSMLAVLVGFVLTELALPSFSSFVQRPLHLALDSNRLLIAYGLALAVIVGLGAGIVPAVLLSRPQPIEIFRGAARLARSGPIMRGMIVIQFALSIFLIIATIIMHQQNQLLQDRPLGYSSKAVMVIERPADNSISDRDFLERFKNELSGNPQILSVTATSASFNRGYDVYGWDDKDKRHTAYVYRVDPGYISTLNMKVVDGRDFNSDPAKDAANPIIVNQSLMRQLGPAYSVGSTIPALDTLFEQFGTPTIVGVVQDYHFLSLHEEIGPALLFTKELYPYFQLLVRIDDRNLPSVTASIEQAFEKVSGGLHCSWSFFDDDLAQQYSNEQRWSRIVTASALFAVSIASLGMFGLAGITAVRRNREVGIRKVLGASVYQVLTLINREFLLMVLAANLLVWPVAWYFADKWLQNFAYHIELTPWSFAVAGLVACVAAIAAVSAHTIRAAVQNPVNVLRHD